MKKILVKIIIVLIFSISSTFADVIKDVDIEGNKRISKDTILVLGQIELNKKYNNTELNEILKKLYETNFFEDISLDVRNEILNIKIVENPIIEDIEITGIKNKDFLKKMSEQTFLKDRMSFTKKLLNKDIETIKNFHKSLGFYFVEVNPSLIKNDQLNSIRLKIDIVQGERATIKEILFIGDKKIKDKKLLEVIASEENKFWKFISNKIYLNQNIINLDKRLLKNFYKNEGYYNVEILDSFAELNEKGSFKLVFNINAGDKFYFNDLNLILPDDYEKKDFTKIEKIFNKIKNKKYSLNRVNLILKEIENIATLKLYDFINAKVEEIIVDNNKINFNFNIVDSEKFYVEKVNFFGNFNTIEEVLRNKLIVDEGDPLNEVLYNKSIDQIRSLDFFKNVKSKIVDGSNNNLKVINITVEEKPTGQISAGAGYGTSGSTIAAGIQEKNFLGKGINLDSNFEVSEESVKGRFIYSKPNFNYSENTLFTSLEATTTDNLSNSGYKVSKTGFSVGTKFQQYENFYFNPEIDLSYEDLETNNTASNSLKKQEGSYGDFYFNYGIDYDLRNSTFNPSSGYKTSFYQTVPLISDSSEVANIFVASKYHTINSTSNMIGKASFYFKAVNSLNDSDVRISKRAVVPYSRLRGFEKGKVGPVDNSDYVGGNYVSTVNLSTNIPGILTTVENVDISYFIDAANVWGVDYSDTIDDSNYIRSSTGLSLNLLTPVGPLSFSYTLPMTKKSTDKTESFRFNLGTTF